MSALTANEFSSSLQLAKKEQLNQKFIVIVLPRYFCLFLQFISCDLLQGLWKVCMQ
jgi:hypothetical protein